MGGRKCFQLYSYLSTAVGRCSRLIVRSAEVSLDGRFSQKPILWIMKGRSLCFHIHFMYDLNKDMKSEASSFFVTKEGHWVIILILCWIGRHVIFMIFIFAQICAFECMKTKTKTKICAYYFNEEPQKEVLSTSINDYFSVTELFVNASHFQERVSLKILKT